MPYLHTTDGLLPEFLNVQKPVGVNAPNLAEDVKFVQRLLTTIYSTRYIKVARNTGALWIKPSSTLEINGECDAATRQWIFKFQIDLSNQVGSDILIDGRVDPATRSASTIMYLNRIHQLNFPEKHAALLREWKPTAAQNIRRVVTETLRIPLSRISASSF